uniref:C-type lectin domain-containing protein n=1 Tax=Gadus morhua TaxID=8049 RepID=A0A8C5A4U6_GADMO
VGVFLFTLPMGVCLKSKMGLCIPSFCADYRQHCLIETPKSWSDAQSYCRERGHDLATIDDMGAMKSLLALNADRADELWIGLQHGGPERWHWSLRDYRNFVGMDNTSHLIKYESGKWYPNECFFQVTNKGETNTSWLDRC